MPLDVVIRFKLASCLLRYQEFRTAITNEAVSSGKTALLLTAALGAGKTTIEAGYEVPIISQ